MSASATAPRPDATGPEAMFRTEGLTKVYDSGLTKVHALAGVDRQLFDRALSAMPETLQGKLDARGIRVNGLRLPASRCESVPEQDLTAAALFLCGVRGRAVGGALLPLRARCD